MPPIPPPRADGTTTTTEVPLYWAAYGDEGAPPLLVLHGGPGAHHDYLLPQMLALGASDPRHSLLFYDQRGGGRSRTDPSVPVDWRAQTRDVAAVARELGTVPLDLVGYSWGALLALLYFLECASNPEWPRPRRLVLLDPAPATRAFRAPFEREMAARAQAPVVANARAELASSGLSKRDPAAARQRAFELAVAGYFAHPDRAHDLTPFRVIERVQKSVWDSLGDFDVPRDLRKLGVSVPALVLHGRQDPIPLESSEAVASALGAELVVLEDCGHVPYVEQPDAMFAAVHRFLRATAP